MTWNGTVWDSMSYDPETNLVFFGTGNGVPWDQKARSPKGGDNLFASSIVATEPTQSTVPLFSFSKMSKGAVMIFPPRDSQRPPAKAPFRLLLLWSSRAFRFLFAGDCPLR